MIETPNALFKQISHGVYVVGVSDGTHQNAFTAAWVMQVSFNPPLLAISINPEHYSYQLLQAGGVCTVNVLGQDQHAIAEHFGCSANDKMAGFNGGKAQQMHRFYRKVWLILIARSVITLMRAIIKSQFAKS